MTTGQLLPVVQLLSTNGDGTGTTNLGGDYSDATGSGSTDFYISDPAAPSVDDYVIARLIFYIEDNAISDAGGFGAGSALSNGITLTFEESDDTVLWTLTPQTIKTNAQLAQYAYDADMKDWGTVGQGTTMVVSRWTFSKFVPDGISLAGGRKIVANAHDDMDHLVNFTICAQGYSTRRV